MAQHFKFLKKKLNQGISALLESLGLALDRYLYIGNLIFKGTQLAICYKYLYDTGIGYRYLATNLAIVCFYFSYLQK